jgi:hypothetical protein
MYRRILVAFRDAQITVSLLKLNRMPIASEPHGKRMEDPGKQGKNSFPRIYR